MRGLRWLLLLLPQLAWLSTCSTIAWRIYVDSGDPVNVVVRRGAGFDVVEVAGRAPVPLPADVVPVLGGSDDASIASGRAPDPATGQPRPCRLWNPTEPYSRGRPDACYRLSGRGGQLTYRPGLVDDAGSLYEDRYRVEGRVVTPESTRRLGFFDAAFGWVGANVVGGLAALVARALRALLRRAVPALAR
jgi:hypothetical protein